MVEDLTSWTTKTFSGLFDVIQSGGSSAMDYITSYLTFINPFVLIALITALAYFLSRKKSKKSFGLALFTLLGLLFIYNQGLWGDLINTFTLVLVASVISVILGIPLGIWMAKSDRFRQIISPILDFMQTMPAFVYLIPAVAFFGIGMVPGVFASVIFALPPTVRFTNLGIREVSGELSEAADSFGSTSRQKLFKVELPIAKDTIVAGISQTIMLALSMVVTGSMIGSPGLGRGVLSALQKADIGAGFVNGLALVILAILIDRISQLANHKSSYKPTSPMIKKIVAVVAILSVIGVGIAKNVMSNNKTTKETIRLSYVQWDSEIASTNVLAEVLREYGYNVELTPLDNSVVWKSVAEGTTDASVSAWLPVTHAELYDTYKDSLEDLGPNLEGVKLGLVVPEYVSANSISELSDEAKKTITGIEPGAGIMAGADSALETYSNLSGWQVSPSSTGAMVTALDKAISAQEDIIVTGWSPHWMFAKYDLKYLEDPEGVFGGSESIKTMARLGLKEDHPEAYQIIDNFEWTSEDMESVMLDIQNGASEKEAAQKWVSENKKTIEKWAK
ncbi:ABC transporter permease/substrate binding protein [Streptococcus zalophi]|uniref:ABC transporter permease/substrate binding protein n=1 Tax=Streptococcus zalophi TaxID=640031 RepID=A0A934UD64_9STRE|nr:ABC transporter permease/substrate binding protein [Streptococcus zalophi]MBJ8349472.1 ABC transporter permease/substrate binding protein [Streptococcus zalophi]